MTLTTTARHNRERRTPLTRNGNMHRQAMKLFAQLSRPTTDPDVIAVRQAVIQRGVPYDKDGNVFNIESIAAMLEAEEIARDPSIKGLPVEEALKELKR